MFLYRHTHIKIDEKSQKLQIFWPILCHHWPYVKRLTEYWYPFPDIDPTKCFSALPVAYPGLPDPNNLEGHDSRADPESYLHGMFSFFWDRHQGNSSNRVLSQGSNPLGLTQGKIIQPRRSHCLKWSFCHWRLLDVWCQGERVDQNKTLQETWTCDSGSAFLHVNEGGRQEGGNLKIQQTSLHDLIMSPHCLHVPNDHEWSGFLISLPCRCAFVFFFSLPKNGRAFGGKCHTQLPCSTSSCSKPGCHLVPIAESSFIHLFNTYWGLLCVRPYCRNSRYINDQIRPKYLPSGRWHSIER